MGNSYFNFKEFSVQQEHCSIKVGTDSCLFGAWVANEIQEEKIDSCLDIGTGTGLLGLMLAQKKETKITAIEIDREAMEQAAENFAASPWKDRLQVIHGDIKQIVLPGKFDLIISNPPFFESDLRSADNKKNLAMHSDGLKLEDLVKVIVAELHTNGSFAVLLPFHRSGYFEELMTSFGFFLTNKMLVRQTVKHGFFRSMMMFSREQKVLKENEIAIRGEQGKYSAGFVELLRDYYLYL